MTNYDFHKLSPLEFEDLSRDLIQAERRVTFESFKPGADMGLDGRFVTDKGFKIILQCKRYATLQSLLPVLRKEVDKMKAWGGDLAYLLVTSLGLSPLDKAKIAEALAPLISNQNQIYGREDLNNLIAKNPRIERRWIKLWLPNGDALERMINLDLYNRNQFFIQEAKDMVVTYAYDYNFYSCRKSIFEEKGIIITGDPGAGKTAVAKIISLSFIAAGYDVIKVGDNVNDALRQFMPEKKQVFVYDDFLGENILSKRLLPGEQDDIIGLLKAARNNPKTYVILISRNYLLNEARTEYERLNRYLRGIEAAIVEVDHQFAFDRAAIVYSHLFAADLTPSALRDFIVAEQYLPIIRHDNFNPRIVETIFKTTAPQELKQKALKKQIAAFLDNPFSVWEYPFKKGINDLARDTLLILLTFNGQADYPVLFEAVAAYRKKPFSEPEFKDTLAALGKVFVEQHPIANMRFVQFINPSIRDFLVYFVESNKFLLSDLIANAVFLTQLTSILVYSNRSKIMPGEMPRMIIVPQELSGVYERKMVELYGFPINGSKQIYGAEDMPDDKDGLLIQCLDSMSHTILRPGSETKAFIRKELEAIISRRLFLAYAREEIRSFIQLVSYFEKDPDNDNDPAVPVIAFKELATIILPVVTRYEHRDITTDFKMCYPVKYYQDVVQTDLADEYAARLSQILLSEVERREIKDLSFDLRLIEGRLGIELEDVHEKIQEYSHRVMDDDLEHEDPYEMIGMGHEELHAHQERRELREKFLTLME